MSEHADFFGEHGETAGPHGQPPMPTKRCQSCNRDVPINEWDYGICWRCRDLVGWPYDE